MSSCASGEERGTTCEAQRRRIWRFSLRINGLKKPRKLSCSSSEIRTRRCRHMNYCWTECTRQRLLRIKTVRNLNRMQYSRIRACVCGLLKHCPLTGAVSPDNGNFPISKYRWSHSRRSQGWCAHKAHEFLKSWYGVGREAHTQTRAVPNCIRIHFMSVNIFSSLLTLFFFCFDSPLRRYFILEMRIGVSMPYGRNNFGNFFSS
jgi:hypothetical protein